MHRSNLYIRLSKAYMTNEEMENVVVLISVVCLNSLHIVLTDIHEWKDRDGEKEERENGTGRVRGGDGKIIPRTPYTNKSINCTNMQREMTRIREATNQPYLGMRTLVHHNLNL